MPEPVRRTREKRSSVLTAQGADCQYVINCDGGTPLFGLARTDRTEADAARQLVDPIVDTDLSAIDFNIGTTGAHNCRTRYGIEYDEADWRRFVPGLLRRFESALPRVELTQLVARRTEDYCGYARTIRHYNEEERDLLDIVIRHGHARGLEVHAGVRLNHANFPETMRDVPGPGSCSSPARTASTSSTSSPGPRTGGCSSAAWRGSGDCRDSSSARSPVPGDS